MFHSVHLIAGISDFAILRVEKMAYQLYILSPSKALRGNEALV